MRDSYTPPALVEHPPLTDVTGQTSDGITSDRNLKTNFSAVAGPEILERLASVPITRWSDKSGRAESRHMGPSEPAFQAAFRVGKDPQTIDPVDANGVALAAVQALYQRAKEKDTQLAAQQERIAALEARLAALETKASR